MSCGCICCDCSNVSKVSYFLCHSNKTALVAFMSKYLLFFYMLHHILLDLFMFLQLLNFIHLQQSSLGYLLPQRWGHVREGMCGRRRTFLLLFFLAYLYLDFRVMLLFSVLDGLLIRTGAQSTSNEYIIVTVLATNLTSIFLSGRGSLIQLGHILLFP